MGETLVDNANLLQQGATEQGQQLAGKIEDAGQTLGEQRSGASSRAKGDGDEGRCIRGLHQMGCVATSQDFPLDHSMRSKVWEDSEGHSALPPCFHAWLLWHDCANMTCTRIDAQCHFPSATTPLVLSGDAATTATHPQPRLPLLLPTQLPLSKSG
jgi:hypothetical protein